MKKLVDLELAKKLKTEGYSKPTSFYYQDINYPYSPKGLKLMKNGDKLNHNQYDNFYSAPDIREGIEWLIGKKIEYPSSLVIKLGGKK